MQDREPQGHGRTTSQEGEGTTACRKLTFVVEIFNLTVKKQKREGFVCLRAWIIMKIYMSINLCTDSLSLKFHKDPLIGCGEI